MFSVLLFAFYLFLAMLLRGNFRKIKSISVSALFFLLLVIFSSPHAYSQVRPPDRQGKLDERFTWVLRYGGTPRLVSKKWDWGKMQWVYTFNTGPESWTNQQIDNVASAFAILRDRVLTNPVRECIARNVRKYAGLTEEQAWNKLEQMSGSSVWPKVIIISADFPGRQTGQALIENKGVDIYPNGTFNIMIDNKYISDSINESGKDWAEASLAGTILHEILHQMGNEHPGDADYSQRFFVTVAGDCVVSNGAGDRIESFNLNPQGPGFPVYD
jgi:hypothetical protein